MADVMDMLIATVTCPKCGREFQLLDTPCHESGTQPRKFPGPDAITFPCCGDAQIVHAEGVKHLHKRQII